jgi:cell division protein FtsW
MASRHLNRFSWTALTPGMKVFGATLLLTLIGLFFVLESSLAQAFNLVGDQYYFFRQQSLHFILGLVAMGIGYFMPMKYWQKLAPLAYGGAIFLLIAVIMPGIRTEINGAYRWLYIGSFGLQPIELGKFAIIIFFSSWLVNHQRMLPFLFLTALPLGLVMLQPDLGSTLIVLAITFSLYFVAGGEWKPFLAVSGLGVVLLSLLILLSPYRRERLATFLNPERDPLGASFHIRQITLALGNGGWFGKGIGNSQQKFAYIPEASTDSIFAIVAEEIGFVGSVVLITLFLTYIVSAYQIIKQTKQSLYAQLVGVGILVWLSAQIGLNIAAVVALVPLTGVPLPFFSYGGSSLVMVLFATGVLLHLEKDT